MLCSPAFFSQATAAAKKAKEAKEAEAEQANLYADLSDDDLPSALSVSPKHSALRETTERTEE